MSSKRKYADAEVGQKRMKESSAITAPTVADEDQKQKQEAAVSDALSVVSDLLHRPQESPQSRFQKAWCHFIATLCVLPDVLSFLILGYSFETGAQTVKGTPLTCFLEARRWHGDIGSTVPNEDDDLLLLAELRRLPRLSLSVRTVVAGAIPYNLWSQIILLSVKANNVPQIRWAYQRFQSDEPRSAALHSTAHPILSNGRFIGEYFTDYLLGVVALWRCTRFHCFSDRSYRWLWSRLTDEVDLFVTQVFDSKHKQAFNVLFDLEAESYRLRQDGVAFREKLWRCVSELPVTETNRHSWERLNRHLWHVPLREAVHQNQAALRVCAVATVVAATAPATAAAAVLIE